MLRPQGLPAVIVLTSYLCASLGLAAAPASPQERGYDLAQRQCSRCHALGPGQESPPMQAPPFPEIGRHDNALAFERRLKEIAEGRHGEMPPTLLAPNDMSDLAAYIARLSALPAPLRP